MNGLLRFLLFFGTLVGLIVFVAVPTLASPLLTQMVRDAGLRADEMRVSIAYFDPSLFTVRTQRMRIEATGVDLGPATARGLDLSLGDVALLDRTFETITGNVRDVHLRAGALDVTVDRVEIDGPASAASVAAHFTAGQTAEVVRQAAGRLGVEVRDVRLRDGAIEINLAGFRSRGSLSVEGGALILRSELGPALVLIQPAPADPWRLTGAVVAADGVTIRGVVDAETLAGRVRVGD